MTGASVYLSGALPACPDRFNAAEYCLSPDVPADADAFLAVDGEAGVVTRLQFGELRDRVLRAASAYRAAGVQPGDRVALLLGDVPAFPVAYFGAIAAGAVAVPLSSQLAQCEIDAVLADVAPAAVVGFGDGMLAPDALAQGTTGRFETRTPEDPALLVYTSGSSGRPKGVLHGHRAFWARQSMRAGWHDIRAGDRVMHAGAFNWTFTLGVGLADTWSVGATAILNAGSRAPEVWPALARQYEPTVFAGAPAVYRRILKYGDDLGIGFRSLRHAVTAGEALSPSIARAWRAATGKPLLEALGMSEVSTFISTGPDHAPEAGIAGWPQPGRRVAVLDETGAPVPQGAVGTLAVHRSDPGLFQGYWNDADRTAAAMSGDWFLTGDLVSMRGDGAIAHVGRADDQMNAQGYRVDPREVEAAAMMSAGVSDCAARALQVEDGLSVIAIWIVPDTGADLERAALEADLANRLAAYKCPRAYFLLDDLPRTANGKLMRRTLTAEGAVRL
ncbi:MAG: acyl-CoA synthetase [Pseudomonadota bacterium]